jgi:hypothetical protein
LKALTLFRVLEGEGARPQAAASPVRRRIRILDSDDAFAPRLSNTLAAAGAEAAPDAALAILSGVPRTTLAPEGRMIAVGEGALWLLAADGIAAERLPKPEIARSVRGLGVAGGFLGVRPLFAGQYATAAIRPAALKAGWRPTAVSEEGWLLAAQQDSTGRCALLYRPDSVLSMQGDSGARVLAEALAWSTRDKVKT